MVTMIQNFVKVISTISLIGVTGAFTYSLRDMKLPEERGLCFWVALTGIIALIAIWYG